MENLKEMSAALVQQFQLREICLDFKRIDAEGTTCLKNLCASNKTQFGS